MRVRVLLLSVAVFASMAIAPGVGQATPPDKGCPSESSGWRLVDLTAWWHYTMLGLDEEFPNKGFADGGSSADPDPSGADYLDHHTDWDAVAVQLGDEDWIELYGLINGPQWTDVIDLNGDGVACMKDLPDSQPAYFFLGLDNHSASKRGSGCQQCNST